MGGDPETTAVPRSHRRFLVRLVWWGLAVLMALPGLGLLVLAATDFTRGQSEDPSLLKAFEAFVIHLVLGIALLIFSANLARTGNSE